MSAEGERKGLRTRIKKLDLEPLVRNRLRLSDQLIQPLLDHRALALIINVNAVRSEGRLSVDEHAKSHGGSSDRWSHDEMKIARMKAVRDAPIGLVQHDRLFP